ncbi:MAG: DUF4129 domain-containing protein [Pirellula sp.]|nr:DUF4129 domain-containing protein [Pirellula sp.]
MNNDKKIRPEGLDYLLASIAPFFIIGMIGSLVFFLITVCYQGSYTQRLMWILGLYTVASVLIARIAIEQSRTLSYAYMLALAGATLLVTPQFFVVTGPMAIFSFPILIALLVIVAVLADRITFDCTSMNEQVQSSGVGILQSLGLIQSERNAAEIEKPNLRKSDNQQIEPTPSERKTANSRKHNPGVWVLYFALLALPLFGLGQLIIQNPEDRSWAFKCLFLYLLCSLCLLVLIALLSLRKYLRERGVPMETSFAIRWLAIGMLSVFAMLCVLSLLPLPGKSLLSMDMPFRITSRDDLKTSRWGWGPEGVPKEGGKPGQPQDGGKPQGEPAPKQPNVDPENQRQPGAGEQASGKQGDGKQGDGKQGEGKQGEGKQGDGKQGNGKQGDGKQAEGKQGVASEGPKNKQTDQASKDEKGDSQNEDERDGKTEQKGEKQDQQKQQEPGNAGNQPKPQEQQQAPPPTQSMSIQWNFSSAFQWLAMFVLAIVAVVFGIRYRQQLLQAWTEFRDWLNALLGRKTRIQVPVVDENVTLIEDPFPPFQSFGNPFTAGNRWTREQIVRHMYRATVSWGYEHRVVRRDDETPEEFMRRLARRFPQQQELLSMLGQLYNRIAYARGTVRNEEMKPMGDLWRWLSETEARATTNT